MIEVRGIGDLLVKEVAHKPERERNISHWSLVSRVTAALKSPLLTHHPQHSPLMVLDSWEFRRIMKVWSPRTKPPPRAIALSCFNQISH